uniref:Uncharacterized protein n=1 Tax=Pipistrellus kuhlii TaxID=59472 RepID=A0A7J7RE00_PIPKU|nr:hypothetical protein mPipKuh1_010565 [Pipistrellus kuhlii]
MKSMSAQSLSRKCTQLSDVSQCSGHADPLSTGAQARPSPRALLQAVRRLSWLGDPLQGAGKGQGLLQGLPAPARLHRPLEPSGRRSCTHRESDSSGSGAKPTLFNVGVTFHPQLPSPRAPAAGPGTIPSCGPLPVAHYCLFLSNAELIYLPRVGMFQKCLPRSANSFHLSLSLRKTQGCESSWHQSEI